MEKKFDENGGLAVPKMTVMTPRVVNVDGPSENVAREGLICAHDDPAFYKGCVSYNTLFCKIECSENAERKKPIPEWVKEYIGEKPIPDLDCGIYTEYEYDAQKLDGQKIKSQLGTDDNPFPETAVNSILSRDPEDELNIAPEE